MRVGSDKDFAAMLDRQIKKSSKPVYVPKYYIPLVLEAENENNFS